MNSFYGGLTGQHFKFSAIFPSRTALVEDLSSTTYSPVGLDEFVLISYGMQNLTSNSSGMPLSDYDNNRKADLDKYGRTFNSTLWQKVYSEDLQQKDDSGIIWYKNSLYTVADIEGYQKNSDNEINMGYCYICLGTFTGTTPLISVERINIAPADQPEIEIDNSEIDKPKITFSLPEAVEFFWDVEVNLQDQDPTKIKNWIIPIETNIKNGDYIISKIDNIYLYKLDENNNPYLEYKGTFIPVFKQNIKTPEAFDNNGERREISIEFKQQVDKQNNPIHNHYEFNTNIPQLPRVGNINVENVNNKLINDKYVAGEAEVALSSVPNSNNIDLSFKIPVGLGLSHKWENTVLSITSSSGTTGVDLKGEKGDAAAPEIKYVLDVNATPTIPEGMNYVNDIIEAINKEGYSISSQELIYINYIINKENNTMVGYVVTNPSNIGQYKIISLNGGGAGGSGIWEELE